MMENKKFKLSRSSKQILIAASALVTMGVGTSLKHEIVVKADTTDDTSAAVTNASSTSTTNTSSTTQTNTNSTDTTTSKDSSPSTAPTVATKDATTTTVQSTPVSQASSTVVAPLASAPSTVTTTASTPVTTTATLPVSTTSALTPVTATTASDSTPVAPTAPVTAPAATTVTQPTTQAPASSVASTANDFLWDTDDTNLTASVTGINGDYTEVNIPSTVNLNSKNYNVTSVGSNAFVGNTNITSVTINDGLQTIGDGAFAYIPNLTTVDMSKNTTLTTIGNDAFTSSKVSTVDIPSSVTSIGDDAFAYNSNLSTVNLDPSLTTIGKEAFADDTKLTTLTLPSSVQTIGDSAFTSDTGITEVNFGSNSQLKTIGDNAFAYNVSLNDITLPDSLASVGDGAFLSDIGLGSVKLGSGLTSVGNNAFLYDNKLTDLDLSNATSLTTIGSGAFEYAGVTGKLSFPDSLTSVGEQAFAGDNITGVTFGKNLQTIGNTAFAFNNISGAVEFPATTTNIGSEAFLGNQISTLKLDGSQTKVQDSAFKYNRITSVSAPEFTISGVPATDQVATIFTDPAHNVISDLFDLNADGFTEENLNVNDLTNGVTYSYVNVIGTFNIPTGTNSFTFNWNMTNGYSGQYNVVLNNPDIKAVDSQVMAGSDWNPQDNFVSAQLQNGDKLNLNDLTVSVVDSSNKVIDTVDTSTPGTYKVTYSYGNDSTTVTVAVMKKDGTYNIIGSSDSDYSGVSQTPDYSKYAVELSDGTTYTLQSGDLVVAGDDSKDAGTYMVTLSQQGIDNISKLPQSNLYNWSGNIDDTATYTINKANVTITADSVSKYAGETDPALTATFTGPATLLNHDDLQYTVERVAGDDVGEYPISISYNANPNYNVTVVNGTFEVLPSKSSLAGSDYTMYIGDPAPTVSDFKASATDENGNPEAVILDLSKADYSKAGDYEVGLSTADGQKKTVVLHVLSKNDSGGGTTTTPTDPSKPTTPSKPEPPVDPDEPSTPTEPDDPEPENPDVPAEPEEPSQPDKPTTPIIPELPNGSTDSSDQNNVTVQKPSKPINQGTSENEVQKKSQSIINGDSGNTAKVLPAKASAGNIVVLSSSQQVALPSMQASKSQASWEYPAQSGRLPQTGSSNGMLTSLAGIVIAVLGLLGIDIKKRKI